MKRVICIMMAGFFALVFSFGEVPLYSCVKKNALHAMNSCCEAPPKVQVKTSCCGETKEIEIPQEPRLEAVCCHSLEKHLDLLLLSEGEIKAVDKVLSSGSFFTSSHVVSWEGHSVEKTNSQRGPPDRSLMVRGLNSPLFKLYDTYLI